MGAKRVASDFKAREKLRRENSLALARELIDNVLWNCAHNRSTEQILVLTYVTHQIHNSRLGR